jgi:Holliday junction resolvase RusA-like endonuclease
MYNDKKTVGYEYLIRAAYLAAAEAGGWQTIPAGNPVDLYVTTGAAIPKSWTKAQRKEVRDTRKPDADNIAKIVMDALNGVAWHDDAQIADLTVTKRNTTRPDMVGAFIEIRVIKP